MELIKSFENKKLKQTLTRAFNTNIDHFKILTKCRYENGNFKKYDGDSFGGWYKFSLYKNKKNSILCYGTKLIERDGKLKSVRDLLFWLSEDFKFHQIYAFNEVELFHITTNHLRFLPNYIDEPVINFFYDYLMKTNSWLKFYDENNIDEDCNVIFKNKLFSLKKYYAFIYPGISFDKCKMINKMRIKYAVSVDFVFILDKYFFNENKEIFDNLQNINLDLFTYDSNEEVKLMEMSVSLAKILNKKINCAWTKRRLEEFLDESSFYITSVFSLYKNEKLKPNKIFVNFSKKYKLHYPKTFGELVKMGFDNRNCLGTYYNNINSGDAMILEYKNFAFELNKMFLLDYVILSLNQIRGKYNSCVPDYIKAELQEKIDEFNNTIHPGSSSQISFTMTTFNFNDSITYTNG